MEYEENHDSKAGKEILCGHEWPGPRAQEVGHGRVFFDCTEVYQVKREKAIGDARDQQQDDAEHSLGLY